MAIPLALLPVPRQLTAYPSLGSLFFFEVGTLTPQLVYADSGGVTPLGSSVDLDADGRAPQIYISPTGYKVILYSIPSAQVTVGVTTPVWTADDVEDVGQAYLATLANFLTIGATVTVTDGYTVPDDGSVNMVIANMTTTGVLNLPDAATRGQQLTVKNVGSVPMLLTPKSGQTVDRDSTAGAPYSVPASATPQFPSAVLYSDGISNFWIGASHKLS